MSADRRKLLAKLERLVDWLDATPTGRDQDRALTIEVGVDRRHRATVDLNIGWIAKRKGKSAAWNLNNAPLGSRRYGAEGRTLRAALGRLHVPRVR